MTTHAIERLEERYHMSMSIFNKYYKNAVAKKKYFKKITDNPLYKNNVSVCIKAGSVLMVVVLDKRNGKLVTILRPTAEDYKKARALRWFYG